MDNEKEEHPILDDPYTKSPKFTWSDSLFLMIFFIPFVSDVDIFLAASIAFGARAGYDLLRKETKKSVLINLFGGMIFLCVWFFLR